MAVLRPDQSQLTIQAEIVPGADSEIIIPDTVHMIDGSSIRGVYFSSSSTDLAVYPSGSATAYNATVEAMDPVLPGAISCYVNPVQYVAVGDFICFEYEDFLLESLPATTDQRSIPYLDALIASKSCLNVALVTFSVFVKKSFFLINMNRLRSIK